MNSFISEKRRGTTKLFSLHQVRNTIISSATMNHRFAVFSLTVFGWASGFAQLPDHLVVEGVPPTPPEVKSSVGRYLEFRAAAFHD